jgi:hypothetical protein
MPYKNPDLEENKAKSREATKKYMAEWRKNNPELNRERKRLDYIKNKEKVKAKQAQYRIEHRDEILARQKAYQRANRALINKTIKNRLKIDVNFKLREMIRCRIKTALARGSKSSTSEILTGCKIDFLRNYIESMFTDGMSWENHGISGWHIDHIIPCASFDLTDIEQQKKCFHYTNLQPLWAAENLRKGDRMNYYTGGDDGI